MIREHVHFTSFYFTCHVLNICSSFECALIDGKVESVNILPVTTHLYQTTFYVPARPASNLSRDKQSTIAVVADEQNENSKDRR